MINVSSEFKDSVKNAREYIGGAEITLSNNTVITIDDSHIRGLKIDDAVSKSGSFTIGSAIINKLTIIIDNINEEFSGYDFYGAIIRPTVGLQLSSSTETLQKGVYIADDVKTNGSIITIEALDRMNNFDKPFSEVTQSFPCTAGDLLYSVCLYCEVPLSTTTFLNSSFIIQSRPNDEATTCREIVSWIAQLSCKFARINNVGALELKWYDYNVFIEESNYTGGLFDSNSPYSSGDTITGGDFNYSSSGNANGGDFDILSRYHHIYAIGSISVSTDDVVITGLQVSDISETPNTALYGQTGYVISIEKNYLIQRLADAQSLANSIGPLLVGMTFRPLSITAVSDPSREAGDVAYVTDRKSNTYITFMSTVTFSLSQNDHVTCEAETPLKNSSTRYDVSSKTLLEAKKSADAKITAYDLMVQQLNNLISHSFGFYSSEEILLDGSKIYYKHDKPTRAESTKIWKETIDAFAVSTDGGLTYTAGFDVNGNAVVNVLSAIGINCDWLRSGKIMSPDGDVYIDMAYGVVNTDNISYNDNIQNGYPLIMPFNIDESVSKINKVLLKFTQQNFRTYSKNASYGGGSSSTSTANSQFNAGSSFSNAFTAYMGTTSSDQAGTGYHSHLVSIPDRGLHNHDINIPPHTHNVSVPSHTHELDFGIQESAISDYSIDIYVDGILRASIANSSSNTQGIVDLTSYVTTVGWHSIEIRSTTLKKISAQVNVKSYIRR